MISREVYVFLAMIICGGALAVVFDMLRAMRMVLNPSAVIVSASDILFLRTACDNFGRCFLLFAV